MQTVLQGEDCTKLPSSHTELPACTVILLSEPNLIKEFPNPISINRTETFPMQSELCSYIPISIFTHQSSSFLTNQDSTL